jgi:DNA-binding transcriptional LysR family regulator
MLDSLNALNVFVRAAEVRSFTSAGRQLSLSSSAVGKAIARLEEKHGVRLFHRNTRSIALTQEGQVFLECCQRIFSEIKSVECEFAQTKGAPKGKLRVGLPSMGVSMMPILSEFMRTYPEVELDMDFADHIADVITGGYDVVVCCGDLSDSRLMARTLGTYRLQVVGSPEYFQRAGIPLTPEDLAGHACLHQKHPATGKVHRWPFATSPSGNDVNLPVTAAVSTWEPMLSLAELGLGIACLPDFAVRQRVVRGSLVAILGDHIEHKGMIRALWPSSRYLSPKLRVFIDFLAEHLFPMGSPGLEAKPQRVENGRSLGRKTRSRVT